MCSVISSVKVVNESTSDIRRFPLPPGLSYDELKSRIEEIFGPGPWAVSSADGPVWGDSDFQRAVQSAAGSVLRVTIRCAEEGKIVGDAAPMSSLLQLEERLGHLELGEGWQRCLERFIRSCNLPDDDAAALIEMQVSELKAAMETDGTSFAAALQRLQQQMFPNDATFASDSVPCQTQMEWDEELALLTEGGMRFEEALARMRARREPEGALPELTAEQIELLCDDDVFELARPMLEGGEQPLDAVLAECRQRVPKSRTLTPDARAARRLMSGKWARYPAPGSVVLVAPSAGVDVAALPSQLQRLVSADSMRFIVLSAVELTSSQDGVVVHTVPPAELSTAVMAMLNEAPEIQLVVTDDAELALQVLSARPAATHVMKPSRLAALLALDDSDSEPEEDEEFEMVPSIHVLLAEAIDAQF